MEDPRKKKNPITKATLDGISGAVSAATRENADGNGLARPKKPTDMQDPRASSNASYASFVQRCMDTKGVAVLNVVQYDACADHMADFVGEGWNGSKDERDHDGPKSNLYEPEALPKFVNVVSQPVPKSQDPPDNLATLQSVKGRDSRGDCSRFLWAPQGNEDVNATPFAFAYGGPAGVHFYNSAMVHEKFLEMETGQKLLGMLPNAPTASWLYVHEKSGPVQKVVLGDLEDPTDIVLDFEIERDFHIRSACWLNPNSESAHACLFGDTYMPFRKTLGDWPGIGHIGYHVAQIFDVESGDVVRTVPTMRADPNAMIGLEWGTPQSFNATCSDPVRSDTAYFAFGDTLVIYDGREKRMARWHDLPHGIGAKQVLLRDSGNVDRLLIQGEHLLMFDLVAGKLRHVLKEHNGKKEWGAMSTYGDQIAVSFWNEQEPLLWMSWDNFDQGAYHASKTKIYGPCGGRSVFCNSLGVFRTLGSEVHFGKWQEPLAALGGVARVDKLKAVKQKAAPPKKGRRRPARSKANSKPSALDLVLDLPVPSAPEIDTKKRDYGEARKHQVVGKPDMAEGGSAFWAPEGTVDPTQCGPYRFIAGGRKLVFMAHDGTTKKVELKDAALSIAAHPKSDLLAITTKANKILFRKLSAPEGPDLYVAEDTNTEQDFCAFTTDGLILVTLGMSGFVTTWDAGSGRRLSEFQPTKGRQQWFDIKADPNRPKVLYIGGIGAAHQIDLDKHMDKTVRDFPHPLARDRPFLSIAIQDCGKCDKFAIAGKTQCLVFNIKNGACLATLELKDWKGLTNYGPLLIGALGNIVETQLEYYLWDDLDKGIIATSFADWSSSPHKQHKLRANSQGVFSCDSSGKVQLFGFK